MTAAPPAVRARQLYVDDTVATASPARLVTLLYDRLVLDLERAERALAEGDRAVANRELQHAQDVVLELRCGLRPELWDGGPALASLYAHLVEELVGANVAGDAGRVATCRSLVEPLRAAWHQAVAQVAPPGGPVEVVA